MWFSIPWARATNQNALYSMEITGFKQGSKRSQDRWIASYTDPQTCEITTYPMNYDAVRTCQVSPEHTVSLEHRVFPEQTASLEQHQFPERDVSLEQRVLPEQDVSLEQRSINSISQTQESQTAHTASGSPGVNSNVFGNVGDAHQFRKFAPTRIDLFGRRGGREFLFRLSNFIFSFSNFRSDLIPSPKVS